jgi:membrane protein involved in colicin uptake
MKATVNNSANFVINNDMLNETKCLKYVSKPTMLEEIVNIQVALAKLNSNYTPRQYTEKNSKQELFEGYGRLVTIYKELSEKREAEIAKNVATCIKTADVLAEEARAKAEAEAAKKAEEEAKRAKKAAKVAKPEAEPKAAKKNPKENVNTDKKARRGDAQERLDKYTAELKEKEAIAEPSKEVKHRIASLKRKIARAEKALGNVTVTNE